MTINLGFSRRWQGRPGAVKRAKVALAKRGAPREVPILFSSPMVLAILGDRKTVTRRVVKQVATDAPDVTSFPLGGGMASWVANDASVREEGPRRIPCPWRVGDRLWVRETLASGEMGWVYRADETKLDLDPAADPERYERALAWAAEKPGPICTSIHMPRWASRITLEITDVRIERLQDITEVDARAEGVDWASPIYLPGDGDSYEDREDPREVGYPPAGSSFARSNFQRLWESINGKRAPWLSNPWVWCVAFRRETPTGSEEPR